MASSAADGHRPELNVLLFGATGRAGSGALEACLESDTIAEVRAMVRRPLGREHKKLRQITCTDFENFEPVTEAFRDINTCLFCLGTSVRNVKTEGEYRRIHVAYALAAARMVTTHSPDATFIYVSGSGTHRDSRMMWARVKAEAEDALNGLGLRRNVNVRPGAILGKDMRSVEKWLLGPLVKIVPSLGIEARALGCAMLNLSEDQSWTGSRVLENRELLGLAEPKMRIHSSKAEIGGSNA